MASEKWYHGICKQVNQGDSITVREKPVNGPPPTKTIGITNIMCPRLQFRPSNPTTQVVTDEKFAWEAREFLRCKAVGQEVIYTETKMPKGGIYGDVYLGRTPTVENNIAFIMVSEGFAEVRKITNPEAIAKNKIYPQLVEAETKAKAQLKGRWDPNSKVSGRSVCWNIPDTAQFLQNHAGQEIPGIVEYVRDGSSMQISLCPDGANKVYYPVMIALAGVKTPGFKDQSSPEKFANEARFFVESRLLQRDVLVRLVSCSGQQNFLGIVSHPTRGDICEFLLAEGLARCLEWGMESLPPQSALLYRQKELEAKEARKNTWADYKPPAPVSEAQLKLNKQRTAQTGNQFTGTIIEVGLGDNVTIKCDSGMVRKVFLSSVRPVRPSMEAPVEGAERVKVNKPLYDIPYMFEAREFLRKHVGKQVKVHIDYVLPKPEGNQKGEDRICATVEVVGGINLAKGLIARGLGQVVKYRKDSTDPRAKFYDQLLLAEQEAATKALGWHSKSAAPVHRVTEISGNASKLILPVLERAGKIHGMVEFVPTAGRLKVFLPQFNNVITVLLAGIDCARSDRTLANGTVEKGDAKGNEAAQFTREHCMQRNVDLVIEGLDRAGNFIGNVYLRQNFCVSGPLKSGDAAIKSLQGSGKVVSQLLNVVMVLQGFATVNKAPRNTSTPHIAALVKAQNEAMAARVGLWGDAEWVRKWQEAQNNNEPTFEQEAGDSLAMEAEGKPQQDGKSRMKSLMGMAKPAHLMQVALPDSAADVGVRVFLQLNEDFGKMNEIQRELNAKPPTPAECEGFRPQRGQLCAAKFSQDGQWYRANITAVSAESVSVLYVDFGNTEEIVLAKNKHCLGPLSGKLASMPLITKQYRLSGLCMPPDFDDRYAVVDALMEIVGESAEVLMVVENQAPVPCHKEDKRPVPLVLLFKSKSRTAQTSEAASQLPEDIGEELLRKGLVYVERIRMAHEQKTRYEDLQGVAKKARLNIWRHGDCRPDD